MRYSVESVILDKRMRLWVMRPRFFFSIALFKRAAVSDGTGFLRHRMPCGLTLAIVDTLMLHQYDFIAYKS